MRGNFKISAAAEAQNEVQGVLVREMVIFLREKVLDIGGGYVVILIWNDSKKGFQVLFYVLVF